MGYESFVSNAPGKFFELPTEVKMEKCEEMPTMEYEMKTPEAEIMDSYSSGVSQMKKQKSKKTY